MRRFILSVMIFAAAGFFSTPSEVAAQTPDWVVELRRQFDRMDYDRNQPLLSVLQRTRKGNCLASAKLTAEVAIGHGLACEYLEVTHKPHRGKCYFFDGNGNRIEGCPHHALALVHDRDGRLWRSSNFYIERVSSIRQAIEEWAPPSYSYGWMLCDGGRYVFRKENME